MASRKRSREAQDDEVIDDEVAPHSQREKVADLGGAGVKGGAAVKEGERGGQDDHEAAAAKGCLEGQQPSGPESALDFVDPLPKLIVLDLDKTVR